MRRFSPVRHPRFALTAFFISLCVALLSAAGAPPAAPSAATPGWARPVDAILREPGPAQSFWGVAVYSLDQKRTLYAYNAERLFTPASNTKLFTTAAALHLLGPDYRFHTSVEAAAAPDSQGRIAGDLVLVGRGDPTLSGRTWPYQPPPPPGAPAAPASALPPDQAIENFADQLQQRGVKVVEGDIIGDDSYFADERWGEGWSQDDLVWDYGAPVSALTINDNVMLLDATPAARVGDTAVLRFDPWQGVGNVINRLQTVAAGGARDIELERRLGSEDIEVWGTIPQGSAIEHTAVAVTDPALFAARLLQAALARRGILVYGRPRARHDVAHPLPGTEPVAAGGRVELAAHDSIPLGQDLQLLDKISQNLHAELVFRLLGKLRVGKGSLAGGRQVVTDFLTQAGVPPQEYFFRDGSGMSRENLVAPEAVVRLLTFMDAQPEAATWRSLLPIGGRDGSLGSRFRNADVRGRILAKTGTLEHVRALSGYATTARGERLAFSILVNNSSEPGPMIRATMDRIVTALVQ